MEVRELMAKLGFRTVNEMVGRTDKLDQAKAVEHFKARGLDLSPIFHQPKVEPTVGRYCSIAQDHGLANALDNTTLLPLCKPALERGEKYRRRCRSATSIAWSARSSAAR